VAQVTPTVLPPDSGDPSAITIERAVSAFLTEHSSSSAPNTIKKYRLIMKQLSAYAAEKGFVMIDQLKPIDIREFRQSWTISPLTASKHLGIVKAFFEYTLVNEWIERNPARLVKLPRGHSADSRNKERLPFSDEELRRMFEACQSRYGKEEAFRYSWTGEDLEDFISVSEYPFWRRQHNHQPEELPGGRRSSDKAGEAPEPDETEEDSPAKDGTVRQEMMTFRAVMNYAARKQYIRESQVPRGRLPKDEARREEFTPQEYRKLHTFARRWIDQGRTASGVWYRTMAYNFVLVMTNTGMRTKEAANLRWRDVDQRRDRQGRPFACLNVRGKGKFRELVAAENVTTYLERLRATSKATEPDDFVFSIESGEGSKSLDGSLIADLLEKSGLLFSSSGSRRSSYCFRHTYATFRLMEGVDVYFLAKQMGTSVKMIEDYYGHITPAGNAERILQGMPRWEPMADAPARKQAA
jgi:site-specific recombinase XerD